MAGTHLSAPESHAQVRAQQDRSPHLNRALDKSLSRSLRWVPVDPGAVAAAAAARRQSLHGPSAAVAAAEAVQAVEAEREGRQEQGQQAATGPAGRGLVGRESTLEASPEAPLDRYDSSLARLSAMPPGDAAEAPGELGQQRRGRFLPARQAASPGESSTSPPPPQQQQQQLRGPPNLATLSATPSVGLDRYEAALTRASMASTAGGSPLTASPSASTFETAHSTGDGNTYGTAGGGSPLDTATSAQSLPDEPAAAQGQPPPRRPSPRFSPQPDLLASDLTATPSVPLERYAAMVAGAEEEEAATAAQWGGGGGAAAGSAEPDRDAGLHHDVPQSSTYPPRHQPHPSEALGRPPRPGMPIRTAPAGGFRDLGQQMQQEASWHKRRSLANLASILEAEQQEEEEGREREGWPRPGSPGPG